MEKFLLVIVLYHCKLENSKTFISLCKAADLSGLFLDLVVYDNSPEYNTSILEENKRNVIYVPDDSNPGVSKAYNVAAEIGLKKGKNWLMIFDQDTQFPTSTFDKYRDSINHYPAEKLFAPLIFSENGKTISPSFYKFNRGFYAKNQEIGLRSFANYSPINCGLCINLDAFKMVGGYNENIKLDFSDFDFIDRFKNNILRTFVVVDLKVIHQLSTETKNSLASEITRFDYYLTGERHSRKNVKDLLFLKTNSFLRALKLSLTHKNRYFILRFFKFNLFKN